MSVGARQSASKEGLGNSSNDRGRQLGRKSRVVKILETQLSTSAPSIPALASHYYKDYGFADAAESHMHRLFMPHVMALAGVLTPGTRVLDVGCGNGAACGEFIRRGCKVVGIDLSKQGITWARSAHPCGQFEILAADELILDRLQESPFDLVISTEVVEHLYAPREWAKGCFRALKPGGRLICTTIKVQRARKLESISRKLDFAV